MRKNYILTLIALGALPASAFAAIDIPGVATDKPSWDLSGVSGVTTSEEGIITVPGAQGGYPACTISTLPAGKYFINGLLTNAHFEILVNGKAIELVDETNENGEVKKTFTTTEAGDLVIMVKADDQSASYSFGDIKLTLDVDLDEIQKNLNDQIAAVLPQSGLTAPSNNMEAYVGDDGLLGTDVIAEYEDLVKRGEAVAEAIDAVNPQGATPEEQLDAYINYEKNNVVDTVKQYAEDVKAYEQGIKTVDEEGEEVWEKYPIDVINGWADTLAANIVKHDKDVNALTNDKDGYHKQLEDIKAQIEKEGNTELLAEQIKAAEDAVAAAEAQVAENWAAEGVQVGKADYKSVNFRSVTAALRDLKNEASKLVSDQNRYENYWLPEYQLLTNEYINAQQAVKELYKDEPGREERQDSVMTEITNIYNDAIDKLNVKFGDGRCSVSDYFHDAYIMAEAIADLRGQIKEDTQALKDEQQALADGTKAVDGLSADLNEIVINDDAYKKAELNEEYEALKAEVSDLQQKIDAIYASTEVLTSDYVNGEFAEEVAELQKKIDNFTAKVDVANQIGALTTALDKARTDIANSEDNAYLKTLDPEYKVDIVDVMKDSYDSIKSAIEQQQGIFDETTDYASFDKEALDNISSSINCENDSYRTNGLEMAKMFHEAYVDAFQNNEDAAALVDYIKDKNPAFDVNINSTLDGRGFQTANNIAQTGYATTANGYAKDAADVLEQIKAARLLGAQNAYDEIANILASMKEAGLDKAISATQLEYLAKVIGSTAEGDVSNLVEVSQGLNHLNGQLRAISSYAGYDQVVELLNKAQESYDKVTADYSTADTVAKYETVNENAKNIIPELQAVQDMIDKVVNNYNAWQELNAIYNKFGGLALQAKLYAQSHSYHPAQDSWFELIEKYVAEGKTIKEALDATYNDVELLAQNEEGKTYKEVYEEQLNNILNWFKNVKDLIDKNDIAHDALLDESSLVTRLADEVKTYIDNAEVEITLEDGRKAKDVFEEYKKELSDLDTELYNTYKDLSCDGQEKVGTETDPTLMDKYEELWNKLNDLKAELDGDYAKALKDYNTQFVKDNWDLVKAELLDLYVQSIISLDEYKAAVELCDTLAENSEVMDAVDHQPIYDFAPVIQQLINDVKTMLDNSWPTYITVEGQLVKNDNQRKLDEDDLKEFIDRASQIEDDINSIYNGKLDKLLDNAEAIYNNAQTDARTLIDNAKSTMEEAGCDEESVEAALKDANTKYDEAVALGQVPTEGRYQVVYVEGLAKGINIFEKIEVTDEQMTAAAQSTFDNAVSDAIEALEKAQETLDNSELPDSKKQELQTLIDEAYDTLNAHRADDITLENLKDELAIIEGINVPAIQVAIDKAIEDNAANEAAKAELDGNIGDLQESFDALKNWIDELLVAADVPTTTLRAQIEAVKTHIEDAYNKGEAATSKEQLQSEIDAAQQAIDDMYKEAYRLETVRLLEEEKEANRAYNERAKQYKEETGKDDYPLTEEGQKYTEKIETLSAELKEAMLVTDVPTDEEQQKIVDIQNGFIQVQIDLGYISPAEIVASLNEAADNCINTINESKENLGSYAAEKYAEEYDKLAQEVENLKQQWSESEASVIVKEEVYLDQLAAIMKQLDNLNAEADKYQKEKEAQAAKEAASNAAYEVLSADLAPLKDRLASTQATIEAYPDYTNGYVDWCMGFATKDINENEAALEEAKANFTCDTFKWPQTLEGIEYWLNNADATLWENITTGYKGQVRVELNAVWAALQDGQHAGQESLMAAYRALDKACNELPIVKDGDAEAGQASVDAANALIQQAQDLLQAIIDAKFVPGDIDGDGEITVLDYNALIDLLGVIDDPFDFPNPAYDVNGDGMVTAADIACIIDLIMGVNTSAPVMSRMPMLDSNNAIYVVKGATTDGVTRYAVMLNNAANFFAAQMDIVLGNGLEIVGEGAAERASKSEFYGSTTNSGKHRVILSSVAKTQIQGTEGEIVYFDVQGDGELQIDNVYGVDTAGRMYQISVMTNVSGIESISTDANDSDIFNLRGQQVNRAERGVNIVRGSDGKASKVYNK